MKLDLNWSEFVLSLDSEDLANGLRPSKRSPRNAGFLTECSGAVGRDGVLQVLDSMTRMDTSDITDDFPYPQIFLFVNITIVCGRTKIYEWIGGSLVEKLTVAAGSTWVALDFHDYVYMSNGVVAVVRDAGTKVYAETSGLPTAMAALNFNGQVLLGSPDAGHE